ncbi:MAG: proline--tRNA ligase [Phycisphaeraceae bacterium]
MSRLFSQTLREAPADAEADSHRLLVRAGFIRSLATGIFSYLPLARRALSKIEAIIREEMDAIGCAEVFLPSLQPIELWERTGRRTDYGDNLFVVKDRHEREQALGPTHEEVVTDLLARCVESYRDLPKSVYQIQTKFRDEFRPRFGVLRSREFQMKDAYSFHVKLEGGEGSGSLDETYQKMYDAYRRIFDRCNIPYEVVEAESGPIGGSASHEFMVPSPTGEDTILANDAGYAANVEKAEIGPRPADLHADPVADLEEIHTPDCPGIESVCEFFKKQLKSKLKPENMLKTLVCKAGERWVLAVVRGDHELNEGKLRAAAGESVALADETEARQAGFEIGFVGPQIAIGRDDVTIVVDPDAAKGGFWVTGANKKDHHVKGFNWKRELADEDKRRMEKLRKRAIIPADIRNAQHGDPAPESRGGGTLHASKGIEVGHIFKLGTKYSEALELAVADENNQQAPVIMGCYGIGVNRILAAAIESEKDDRKGHDDNGIIWPAAIAPYRVLITPIKYEGAVKDASLQLASELEAMTIPTAPHVNAGPESPEAPAPHSHAGLRAEPIDVLIDDRDMRPGPKFKDADLIGIPLRVTIGDKGLTQEPPTVEIKARNGSLGDKGAVVALGEAAARIREILAQL